MVSGYAHVFIIIFIAIITLRKWCGSMVGWRIVCRAENVYLFKLVIGQISVRRKYFRRAARPVTWYWWLPVGTGACALVAAYASTSVLSAATVTSSTCWTDTVPGAPSASWEFPIRKWTNGDRACRTWPATLKPVSDVFQVRDLVFLLAYL